jgi:hypothetical protein
MITTENRPHVLLVTTHHTDMRKIAQAETEIKIHLVESGTEVEAETHTKRKSEPVVKYLHKHVV